MFAAILAEGAAPGVPDVSGAASLLLGYGPLGAFALAISVLLIKRWRFISPDEEAAIRKEVRDEAQAELDRANSRADRAETRADRAEQKYEAVVEDIRPMLSSFVAVTGTLNPILQDIVRYGLPPSRNRRRESE
jgi:hypothetical protein